MDCGTHLLAVIVTATVLVFITTCFPAAALEHKISRRHPSAKPPPGVNGRFRMVNTSDGWKIQTLEVYKDGRQWRKRDAQHPHEKEPALQWRVTERKRQDHVRKSRTRKKSRQHAITAAANNASFFTASVLLGYIRVTKTGSSAMLSFLQHHSGLLVGHNFISSAFSLRSALEVLPTNGPARTKTLGWNVPHCIYGKNRGRATTSGASRGLGNAVVAKAHNMSDCPHLTHSGLDGLWSTISDVVHRQAGVSLVKFTLLRDPFDRLNSLFDYVRRDCNKTQFWKGSFTQEQYDLLCAGDFEAWMHRLHSQKRSHAAGIPNQFHMFAFNVSTALSLIRGEHPTVLPLIQECFEESLRLLEHKFKLAPGATESFLAQPKVNKVKKAASLLTSRAPLKAKAEVWFANDFAFYNAAVDQFWAQVASVGLDRAAMRRPCAAWPK